MSARSSNVAYVVVLLLVNGLSLFVQEYGSAHSIGIMPVLAHAKHKHVRCPAEKWNDPTYSVEEGDKLRSLGETDTARACYQLAVEQSGVEGRVVALLRLVELEDTLGNFNKALEHAQFAARLQPHEADLFKTMGLLAEKKNDLNEAVQAFRMALELNPSYHFYHYKLGQLLRRTHDPSGLDHILEAINLHPSFAPAHFALGSVRMEEGDYEAAMKSFQIAELHGGQDPFAFNNMGICHYYMGRLDLAARAYQRAIAMKSDYAEAHVNLGLLYVLLEDWPMAVQHLREAIRINPTDANAVKELAYALPFSEQKDAVTEAMQLLQTARERFGDTGSNSLTQLGFLALESKDPRTAYKFFKAAKEIEKGNSMINEGVTADRSRASASSLLLLEYGLGLALKANGRLSESIQQLHHVFAQRDFLQDLHTTASEANRVEQAVSSASKNSSPTNNGLSNQLRVFVYDLPPRYNVEWLTRRPACRTEMFGAEIHFHEQLLLSEVLTTDPSEADLFFIPVYSSCHLHTHGLNYTATSNFLEQAQRYISTKYPYWDEQQGANHFWVFANDIGACLLQEETLQYSFALRTVSSGKPLPDPVIKSLCEDPYRIFANRYQFKRIDCSEDLRFRWHRPCRTPSNRDIVIPYLLAESTLSNQHRFEPYNFGQTKVQWRVQFRGSVLPDKNHSGGIRQKLLERYKNDPYFLISSDPDSNYLEEMRAALFCLCPPGWQPNTQRFFIALSVGCIPVLFGDVHLDPFLPFASLLNVHIDEIAVVIPEWRFDELKEVLQSISEAEANKKRQRIHDVWFAMSYQRPSTSGDAFHNTLKMLRQRATKKSHKNIKAQGGTDVSIQDDDAFIEVAVDASGVSSASDSAIRSTNGTAAAEQDFTDFGTTIQRLAMQKNIILAVANSGFQDFALNFVLYLRRLRIDHYIIIALDASAYKYFVQHGVNTYLGDKGALLGTEQSVDYDSTDFKRIMMLRHRYLMEALRMGLNVLLTDVDAVFLENPFPYFETAAEAYFASDKAIDEKSDRLFDSATSSSSVDDMLKDFPDVMGGFFFLKSSENAIAFVQHAWDAMKVGTYKDDQICVNAILRDKLREKKLHVQLLNQRLFLNGQVYFFDLTAPRHDVTRSSDSKPDSSQSPVVIQNNLFIGSDVKRLRFKEHLLWLAEDDSYYNAQRKYMTVVFDDFYDTGHTIDHFRGALRSALGISRLLNRTLILPLLPRFVTGYETPPDMNPLNRHLPNETLSIENFFEVSDLMNRFSVRENSFLRNPLVPAALLSTNEKPVIAIQKAHFLPTVARSVLDTTDNVQICPAADTDFGATENEILKCVEGLKDVPLLRFAGLFRGFLGFSNSVANKKFEQDVMAGLRYQKWSFRVAQYVYNFLKEDYICIDLRGLQADQNGDIKSAMAYADKHISNKIRLFFAVENVYDPEDRSLWKTMSTASEMLQTTNLYTLQSIYHTIVNRFGETNLLPVIEQQVCALAQQFIGAKSSLFSNRVCFLRHHMDPPRGCTEYLNRRYLPVNRQL